MVKTLEDATMDDPHPSSLETNSLMEKVQRLDGGGFEFMICFCAGGRSDQ